MLVAKQKEWEWSAPRPGALAEEHKGILQLCVGLTWGRQESQTLPGLMDLPGEDVSNRHITFLLHFLNSLPSAHFRL